MDRRVKLIVFDFDGTLAQTEANLLALLIEILKSLNYPLVVDEEILRLFREKGARVTLKTLGVKKIDLIRISRMVRRNQKAILNGVKVTEGIRELLNSFKSSGYKLGILTSNSKSNVEQFLKEQEMECFDFVKSSLNIFGKDRALKKIIRREGILNEEMIYVGDEVRDIEACRKVGVPVAVVTWGFNSRESLIKAGPEYIADKPAELKEIVEMMDNGVWKKENST